MTSTITITGIAELRATLEGFSDRRFNAALATGLTKTAQAVREAEQREMRDVFIRPTPRTLGAIFMQRATAEKLEATVGIAENPFSQGGSGRAPLNWLRWQVRGGLRTLKAYERRLVSAGAMPSDMRSVPGKFARLDAFGNISGGQLRQVFSQLRIELSSGAKSTLTQFAFGDTGKERKSKARKIENAYKRAGGQYIAFPNGRGKLLPGIYQVRSTAFGRTDPKPIIIYVSKAEYEAERFDFDYVAQKTVESQLNVQVGAAIQDHINRVAAKRAAT